MTEFGFSSYEIGMKWKKKTKKNETHLEFFLLISNSCPSNRYPNKVRKYCTEKKIVIRLSHGKECNALLDFRPSGKLLK